MPEYELTFTQEQKLIRAAKRFKFDPALVAKAAEGLTLDDDGVCSWDDNTDIDVWDGEHFIWNVIAKVLGEYQPTVRSGGEHNFCGVQRSDAWYYIDPRYELAHDLIYGILWSRFQTAIFKFKENEQTNAKSDTPREAALPTQAK